MTLSRGDNGMNLIEFSMSNRVQGAAGFAGVCTHSFIPTPPIVLCLTPTTESFFFSISYCDFTVDFLQEIAPRLKIIEMEA